MKQGAIVGLALVLAVSFALLFWSRSNLAVAIEVPPLPAGLADFELRLQELRVERIAGGEAVLEVVVDRDGTRSESRAFGPVRAGQRYRFVPKGLGIPLTGLKAGFEQVRVGVDLRIVDGKSIGSFSLTISGTQTGWVQGPFESEPEGELPLGNAVAQFSLETR